MWLCSWSPPVVKGVRQSQHVTIPSLIASGAERMGLCPGRVCGSEDVGTPVYDGPMAVVRGRLPVSSPIPPAQVHGCT